jgi:electron transport complex protein RnfD
VQKHLSLDSLIILPVLSFTAVFYYGGRAFLLLLLSLVTAALTDMLCNTVLHWSELKAEHTRRTAVLSKILVKTLPSALITGFINALILPAAVPFTAVIAGNVIAIALLRYCFGGEDNEIINPSAGMLLFLFYAFPGRISVFTPVFEKLPLTNAVFPDNTAESFLHHLINSQTVPGDIAELLSGRLPSVMGGCALVVAVAAFVYLIRRDIPFSAFVSASAVIFGVSFLVTDSAYAALYALFGVLPAFIFAALPVSARFTKLSARLMYGLILGSLTAVFVWYSKNEYGAFFAAVILSPLAVYLRSHDWSFKQLLPRHLKNVKLS